MLSIGRVVKFMFTGAMTQLFRTFEGWSHRSYKGVSGRCKATLPAIVASDSELCQRLLRAKPIPRLFQLAQ